MPRPSATEASTTVSAIIALAHRALDATRGRGNTHALVGAAIEIRNAAQRIIARFAKGGLFPIIESRAPELYEPLPD